MPWRWTIKLVGAAAALNLAVASGHALQVQTRRNVILFIVDGLRASSVTKQDAPALWAVRTNGVHFENAYSVFPTFTMANAAAIATGYEPGGTGNIGNVLWVGFSTFDTGNFNLLPSTPVPFLENDRVLADLDDHFGGNYLGQETIAAMARAAGYQTAVIGKVGPAAMQDLGLLEPDERAYSAFPAGIVIDDATGSSAGPLLPASLAARFKEAGLPPEAPTRSNGYGAASPFSNGYAGDRTHAGTLAANVGQQQWFADVTTQVVLPSFASVPDRPFALVFWSRDPDGTQHNEGDSLNGLAPGVNGPTSRRSVQNADRNLQQILAWLDAHEAIKSNTDVFVTADHGVSTISRHEIDRTGRPTAAESANHDYVDATGRIDTARGTLPYGFLAIDLATSLKLSLFDPDQRTEGSRSFKRLAVDPATATWEHPILGNGLLGADVRSADGSDARVIVAANGGSDLIYVPDHDPAIVQRVVDLLMSYDYVSGVFVHDRFGPIPGTLPMSALNLVGSTRLPSPEIVVAFKTFYLNPADLRTAILVSDTTLQEGQGMHGGFGRDNTMINVAAVGPDFKSGFVNAAPFGNADVVPTLARIMGLKFAQAGPLTGRVALEALTGGPAAAATPFQYLRSAEANGKQTIVVFQEHDGRRYLHSGCFVEPGLPNAPDVCAR